MIVITYRIAASAASHLCPVEAPGDRADPVVDLVNRPEAEARRPVGPHRRSPASPDRVVLDGLGYLPSAQSSGRLLFHLIDKLYEATSIVVATDRALEEWPDRARSP